MDCLSSFHRLCLLHAGIGIFMDQLVLFPWVGWFKSFCHIALNFLSKIGKWPLVLHLHKHPDDDAEWWGCKLEVQSCVKNNVSWTNCFPKACCRFLCRNYTFCIRHWGFAIGSVQRTFRHQRVYVAASCGCTSNFFWPLIHYTTTSYTVRLCMCPLSGL